MNPEQNKETQTGSEVVSSSVPAEVAALIREDATSDDRSPSYVMCQILKAHYAKRLATKAKAARRESVTR